MSIHPTAIIEKGAEIDQDVTIEPYAVIRSQVKIASGTLIGSHVEIAGDTEIGKNNKICKGAYIGGDPQDVKFKQEWKSKVIIGNNNLIREFSTIHKGSVDGGLTKIGNDNFFMCNVHVGHDCIVGNNVILTNSATLGGWVVVEDRAIISAFVAVHQFCRVGKLAFVGGVTRVIQDVPPYCIVAPENPALFGLNVVGLRRNGIDADKRNLIKQVYRILFRQKLPYKDAIQKIKDTIELTPEIEYFLKFVECSKRGIISKHTLKV